MPPEYIYNTSIQPTLRLGVSSDPIISSSCTQLCWAVTDMTIDHLANLYTPEYPIECDNDLPCGISSSQCLILTATDSFTFPSSYTDDMVFRYRTSPHAAPIARACTCT